MSKLFAAWARVSSARQKKEGFSLEDQEARLTEFSGRLGGSIDRLFKIAETATRREERKTFQEFTSYVSKNAKRLSGMLFVKVDRAARNIRDWADLEELSEATKVPLLFPDQPSGETPAGRMQRRMSAVVASYQTDQQAVDIRAGHKRRIENGLPLGKQFGLRLIRVNGRSIVEHDPIAAPKVKRIFELFAYQTYTVESLVETLARQGIIYTDGSPRFTKSTLHRILHNRIYIAEIRYQNQWHPGKFEPLVDRATFQRVQDKFGTDFKVYHQPELTYAGGLIICGHCGHIVTGENKLKTSPDGTKRRYYYYRCARYNRAGHPRVRMNEKEIDRQLLGLFENMQIAQPAMRQLWIDTIKSKAQAGFSQNHEHHAELLRQRDQVKAKLQTLLNLRMDGEFDADEYSAKRQELYDRQSAIAVQMQTNDVDDRQIADLAIKAFELSQNLKSKWVMADYRVKRTILSTMLNRVRLNSENLEFCLKLPYQKLRDANGVPLSGGGGN